MRAAVSTMFVAGSIALTIGLPAVAVGGCGGEASSTSGDRRPLVTFGRTGGNQGRVYGLVVERGGGAMLTQYPQKIKRFAVGGDARDELRADLEGLDFNTLRRSYAPGTPTVSGYRYSVTYANVTVQAAEAAQIPTRLKSLIDLLNGLVDGEK